MQGTLPSAENVGPGAPLDELGSAIFFWVASSPTRQGFVSTIAPTFPEAHETVTNGGLFPFFVFLRGTFVTTVVTGRTTHGRRSKLNQQGTADFGLCFHLPGQAILEFRFFFFDPQPHTHTRGDGFEWGLHPQFHGEVAASSQAGLRRGDVNLNDWNAPNLKLAAPLRPKAKKALTDQLGGPNQLRTHLSLLPGWTNQRPLEQRMTTTDESSRAVLTRHSLNSRPEPESLKGKLLKMDEIHFAPPRSDLLFLGGFPFGDAPKHRQREDVLSFGQAWAYGLPHTSMRSIRCEAYKAHIVLDTALFFGYHDSNRRVAQRPHLCTAAELRCGGVRVLWSHRFVAQASACPSQWLLSRRIRGF